ncbi:MAG: ABC transporter ATP-binding protein [Pontibacterium sp.]
MSGQSDSIVRFQNIKKTYDGEAYVVKNLNLDVKRGEFLTLLGPSGSGKSTCLMMLAGFESPSSGSIFLDDKELNHIPPHKRDIGVIFQNYALFPHMTVEENVAFPLLIRKVPKHEVASKVKRALDMVQLGHLGSRRPAQMSGGQQQRVAVARSMVFEPQLVLLDEPLGALDKKLRESMQLELKHIHENLGVTMVFVTHDQSEALTMSDRIAVFNDGIIQQIDDPATLYEEPQNEFVANFIGETNMFRGEVMSVQGEHCEVKLENGQLIRATNHAGLSLNDQTCISLRPEQAHFIEDHQSDHCNHISSTVIECIYHGDHMRLSLDAGGDQSLMVKVPSSSLHSQLNSGQRISVGFNASDCRALRTQ